MEFASESALLLYDFRNTLYKLVQTNTPGLSQASEPEDLRSARGRLAESRVSYGEQSPDVQARLARVEELERMTKEEPDATAVLREAKAQLAELRLQCTDNHPRVQEALARIKALQKK